MALGLLGAVTGLAEAALVVLLVVMASGSGSEQLPVAGDLPTATWALAAIALAVLVALALAHLGSALIAAGAASDAQRIVQAMLIDAYLGAPWIRQAAVRSGELQDVVMDKAVMLAHGTQEAATALSVLLSVAVLIVGAIAVSPWAALVLLATIAVAILIGLPVPRPPAPDRGGDRRLLDRPRGRGGRDQRGGARSARLRGARGGPSPAARRGRGLRSGSEDAPVHRHRGAGADPRCDPGAAGGRAGAGRQRRRRLAAGLGGRRALDAAGADPRPEPLQPQLLPPGAGGEPGPDPAPDRGVVAIEARGSRPCPSIQRIDLRPGLIPLSGRRASGARGGQPRAEPW